MVVQSALLNLTKFPRYYSLHHQQLFMAIYLSVIEDFKDDCCRAAAMGGDGGGGHII
jgi:hypothetical protein